MPTQKLFNIIHNVFCFVLMTTFSPQHISWPEKKWKNGGARSTSQCTHNCLTITSTLSFAIRFGASAFPILQPHPLHRIVVLIKCQTWENWRHIGFYLTELRFTYTSTHTHTHTHRESYTLHTHACGCSCTSLYPKQRHHPHPCFILRHPLHVQFSWLSCCCCCCLSAFGFWQINEPPSAPAAATPCILPRTP